MIRTPNVSLDFKRLSISDKVIFSNTVATGIGQNSSAFPNPDITPAALNLKSAALSMAAQQAAGGDHQKVVAMHVAEKALEEALETEAHYVDRIALGNANTIALSGFHATTSETQPATLPLAPTGIKITISQQAGGAHVECDVMHGVTNFMYFVSTTPTPIVFQGNQFQLQNNAGVICFVNDTHRKIDFTNLTGATNYYLTVLASNSKGVGAPSTPVLFRVL